MSVPTQAPVWISDGDCITGPFDHGLATALSKAHAFSASATVAQTQGGPGTPLAAWAVPAATGAAKSPAAPAELFSLQQGIAVLGIIGVGILLTTAPALPKPLSFQDILHSSPSRPPYTSPQSHLPKLSPSDLAELNKILEVGKSKPPLYGSAALRAATASPPATQAPSKAVALPPPSSPPPAADGKLFKNGDGHTYKVAGWRLANIQNARSLISKQEASLVSEKKALDILQAKVKAFEARVAGEQGYFNAANPASANHLNPLEDEHSRMLDEEKAAIAKYNAGITDMTAAIASFSADLIHYGTLVF
ncbi:MAG: hypothetical protein JWO94_1421 [Verrucomicrobiaceae bacterium]|nr:hypothetical protein [Verrucomicrobiaceae bacterium]